MALQCHRHFAVPAVYGAFTLRGAGTDAQEFDCALPSEHFGSGCMSRDGIPALTNPDIIGASNTSLSVRDFDRVLGVVSQDPERLEAHRSPPSTNMEALWRLSCQQCVSHPGSAPGVQRHLERAAS